MCLVSFTVACLTVSLQSSAENALELHGRELEPGHPVNVFVSNPERKKERTDIDANERELYVAGLNKFTTKADLENVFKPVRVTPYSRFRYAHAFSHSMEF
jgi:hypothetical protein